MSDEQQQESTPFLTEVIDFLRPKIVEERRNTILRLAVQWLVGELRTYGAIHSTDDVDCTVELGKGYIHLPLRPGQGVRIFGYHLLVTIQGGEPQHPAKQVDCIFEVENEQKDVIVNLYMSGERPDGTLGTTVQ